LLNDQPQVTNLFVPCIDLVIDMICKNIFRPFSSFKRNNISLGISETGIVVEDQEVDPSWKHLKGIYEIFLQIVVNEACDVRILNPFMTHNFIQEVS